jgi:tripartite-type tricarboxylate transporter receptor subunit TctC
LKFIAAFRTSLLGLSILAAAAHAQVTTIVVPFATGGPTDTSARMIATAMAKESGATFVVENVPGAGATIGATKVAQAKPDGYTLLWGSGSTLAMTPHLYPNLKYDPVKSFAPIGLVVAQPFILVTNTSRNIRSVKELVALAKASPGKLNFSSTGQGASSHLVAELFKAATGVSATHIPYNGGAPGVNALLANDVDFFFDTPTTVVPLIKAGKLTGLAATGKMRWEAVPEVPTMQESGVADFDATTWFGLAAPAGTPPERVAALSRSLLKVLADPQITAALRGAGFSVEPSTPEEFAKKIAADSARWGGIIRAAGVKLD